MPPQVKQQTAPKNLDDQARSQVTWCAVRFCKTAGNINITWPICVIAVPRDARHRTTFNCQAYACSSLESAQARCLDLIAEGKYEPVIRRHDRVNGETFWLVSEMGQFQQIIRKGDHVWKPIAVPVPILPA